MSIQEEIGDREAQDNPEGNVPWAIEDPEVGVPVDDGEPSGEQNDERISENGVTLELSHL